MKKTLSKIALLGAGITLAATTASATGVAVYPGLDTTAGTTVKRLANEAYNKTTGTATANQQQVVVVTNELNQPTNIVYQFDNGQFQNPSLAYNLVEWVDANSNKVIEAGETTTVLDDAAAIVAGVVTDGVLTFAPAAGNTYIDVDPGSKLLVVDTFGPTLGFNWLQAPGLAADSKTALTVYEAQSTPNEKSGSAAFAEMLNQYVACSNTRDDVGFANELDETTDVDADPINSVFTNATQTTSTGFFFLTDRNAVDTSAAGLGCGDSTNYQNTFITTQGVGGGSINKLQFTVNGSASQVTKVTIDNTETAATSGGWASKNEADLLRIYEFTVNGTESIEPRDFTVSIVAEPANTTNFYTIEYGTDIDAGSWEPGGYSSRLPYVPFGYDGFNAFLKASNTHDRTTATVTVNADIQNITDGTDEVATATIGTVAPGTLATISQADIASALGLDPSKQYHVQMTVSASVPAGSFDLAAFQSDPVGRTSLPVYIISGRNQ